ncbi:MAG TPA: F0F1 ATP synthase subunit B [Burkholderiales bacterium]|nr:F0F1 ATP synthase subunit B [Burkholderiales bacterium]
MNINATLIGQSITFFFFVWFCMKFIWPPLTRALADRRQRIADGLAAAERGKQELEQAGKRSAEVLKDARNQATEIIAQGEKRGAQIVEEAKQAARAEGERIVASARDEIEQEVFRARESLRAQVSALAVKGAEKILRREVDEKAHAQLLSAIQAEL